MSEIRYRTSVVVVHQGKVLGFHAEDPINHSRYFFLPGGKIEEGETPDEAVVREAMEETGYRIRIDPKSRTEKRYDFPWNGKIHDCVTIFFRGSLIDESRREVNDASYHRGVDWVPVSQIPTVFTYNSHIREIVLTLSKKVPGPKSE